MTAPLECGGQPDLHNLQRSVERDHSLPQAEHIGVIVLAGESGAFEVPAKRAADAFDFVSDDRFTVAGTAKNDPPLGLSARDRFRGGSDEERVIDWLAAVRAKITDFMAEICEERFDLLFVVEPGVV